MDARKRIERCLVARAVAMVPVVSLGAQTGPAAKRPGATSAPTPRTSWGDPDLQGSWSNATLTPLQRPAKYGTREFLTPEEMAELDKATQVEERGATPAQDLAPGYNNFWYERGVSDGRTSLITDPPDGRIPVSPEGQKKRAAQPRSFGNEVNSSNVEDYNVYDRCIIRAPLPRLSTGYDNNYQIVQTPGYVAILQEQMHEVRVIPTDARPHLNSSVRQWLGDSRGHWEGDTLVVETTNFSDRTSFEGATPNMRLVERWTRVGPDRIDYRFPVEDPAVWTQPWSAALPWNKTGMLFEYACHEGNYSLSNMIEQAQITATEGGAKKGQ